MTKHLPALKWLAVAGLITLSSIDLLGHGPYRSYLDTEGLIDPPHLREYAEGEVGIVRPWFRRRYLVQAYRVFSGVVPLPEAAVPEWLVWQAGSTVARTGSPFDAWFDAKSALLGTALTPNARGREYSSSFHPIGDYQSFQNCNADSYANALRTLDARRQQFGPASAELKGWVTAQVAVFENCSSTTLTLPAPAAATAPPLVRADRAYQTAAAYFYAMDYDESARRFMAIAADAASPWRTWGQYLAARSYLRHATVHKMDTDDAFSRAERGLRAVLTDPEAAHLHRSAQGLLDFIAGQVRPRERLRTLTQRLSAADATVTDQDIYDYQLLMDKAVGNSVRYESQAIAQRDELIKDGLNDWIVAMQATDRPAFDHAWSRWSGTRSPLWLVPVMWKITPDHPGIVGVLQAAAGVPADSSAYPTIAFLRVRLLLRANRTAEARTILAILPTRPQRGFQDETINLFNAARLLTAPSFDDFLAAAPRTIVSRLSEKDQAPRPVALDYDGAAFFSSRLPLSYLQLASASSRLPERVRIKLAAAGLTRALVLQRSNAGVEFAKTLKALRPPLAGNLDPYIIAATRDDRRVAAVNILVHTLGLSPFVPPLEDSETIKREEPRQQFSAWEPTWWCPAPDPSDAAALASSSGLLGALYSGALQYPAFLSAEERSQVERELKAIGDAGAGKSFIAAEAIRWARMRPADLGAAEALSIVINRGRYACGDATHAELAQRAFAVLHRQFPKSEWAKKTKYWYK